MILSIVVSVLSVLTHVAMQNGEETFGQKREIQNSLRERKKSVIKKNGEEDKKRKKETKIKERVRKMFALGRERERERCNKIAIVERKKTMEKSFKTKEKKILKVHGYWNQF